MTSVSELQKTICKIRTDRNLETSILQLCLGLGEETGELFKAIRERECFSIHQNTERYSVPDELGDCFIFLCAIAEWYGLDIEEVVLAKLEKDKIKIYN